MPGDADGICDFGAVRRRILARCDANGDGTLMALLTTSCLTAPTGGASVGVVVSARRLM
jgi:hypothetical protein